MPEALECRLGAQAGEALEQEDAADGARSAGQLKTACPQDPAFCVA